MTLVDLKQVQAGGRVTEQGRWEFMATFGIRLKYLLWKAFPFVITSTTWTFGGEFVGYTMITFQDVCGEVISTFLFNMFFTHKDAPTV